MKPLTLVPMRVFTLLAFVAALGTGSLALAQDQTVSGNLSVTGDTDLGGNTVSVGTRTDSTTTPGLNLLYSDGTVPTIYFNATRPTANWLWQSNTGTPQMQLDVTNTLSLFNPSTGIASVLIDPSSGAIFPQVVGIGTPPENLAALASGGALRLQIRTPSALSGAIINIIDDAGAPKFAVAKSPSGAGRVIVSSDTGKVFLDSGGSSYFTGGNVGIGTSTPAAKLDVAGNANIQGTLMVAGSPVLTANGDGSGLTGLNASQLTTGTLSAALLPSSVVQTTGSQTLINKTLDSATLSGSTVLGGSSQAQQVVVDTSGNVGIGGVPLSQKLSVGGNALITGHAAMGSNAVIDGGDLLYDAGATFKSILSLQEAPTDLTATYYEGITNFVQIDSWADTQTSVYGIDTEVETKAGNTKNYNGGLAGSYTLAVHRASGSIGFLQGAAVIASNQGGAAAAVLGLSVNAGNGSSSTSTRMTGERLVVNNNSAAAVTSATGLVMVANNTNSNGLITTSKGIDYSAFSNSGTITNTYGVYIGNLTGGTQTNKPYSFYAADSAAYNYFAGNVGIGTSTPAATLDVAGNVNVRGKLRVPQSGDLSMGTFNADGGLGNPATP